MLKIRLVPAGKLNFSSTKWLNFPAGTSFISMYIE